ncbi:MAG: lysophospholipid acyltransferase family protein [Candidatus Auribacterota bacterium]
MSGKVSSFFYEKVFPYLGAFVIRALFSTVRVRWIRDQFMFDQKKKGEPIIYAFWHNRLAYMAYAYQYVVQGVNRTNTLVAMISRSKDGRLIGRVIELLGLRVAYGSSSRHGTEALREMIRLVKEEKLDCGITPDGPRGPKYKVQGGVLSVAQATGAPIVPITYDVKHKLVLRSWDRFIVPLPFTHGYFIAGEPMWIPEEISDEEREALQKNLEQRLAGICDEAHNLLFNKKIKKMQQSEKKG